MLHKIATAAAGALTVGLPETLNTVPVRPAIEILPPPPPALPQMETTTTIACFGSAGFVGDSCESNGESVADRCSETISTKEQCCLPATVAPSNWLTDYEEEETHEAFVIRRLLDSGAGRNLVSLEHLPKTILKFIGTPSEQGIVFDTGGGKKAGAKALTTIGSFSGRKSTFVLEDSPPALCLGLQVN